MSLVRSSRACVDALVTVYLFSKSDIKTIIVPTVGFAISVAPLSTDQWIRHLIDTLVWVWAHLLLFNLYNQTTGFEEDMKNKAWRPIPSGRISLSRAILFRQLSAPACAILSYPYGAQALMASCAFSVFTWIYHFTDAHRHWASKNLLNGLGYACFLWGGALLAGRDRTGLDSTAKYAVLVMFGIVTTTIQAQDFQDIEGDLIVGRKTLLIACPHLARYSPLVTMLIWSISLGNAWALPTLVWMVFSIMGVFVGVRYLAFRTPREDQLSYFLYNIWLAIAFCLPGIHRHNIAMPI